MIGESAPLSVVEKMAHELADTRRRVNELERLLQRRQATAVARAEHGFAGIASGDASSLVAQLSAADLGVRGVPGVYYVTAQAFLSFAAGPDYYELEIRSNGVICGANRINAGHGIPGVTGWDDTYSVVAAIATAGDIAVPIELYLTRTPGGAGGYAQFFGTDPRYVQLQAIFIPD